MLENNLQTISDILSYWEKYGSNEAVLTECIREKLHTSTLTYEDELKLSRSYLEASYKALNVLKAAQKIQRRDDIERLEEKLRQDEEAEIEDEDEELDNDD